MAKSNKKNNLTQTLKNYELIGLDPLNKGQREIEEQFDQNTLTLVHGYPGTGKTMYALWLLLEEMQNEKIYDRVIIIRSSVASRDVGFLPGKHDEKIAEFEAPYVKIVDDLYGRDNSYRELKSKGFIQFTSSSFLRGVTFENCVVLVDEFQNMAWNELNTIITRIGNNCKMIMVGDIGQDDLTSERFNEFSGASKMMDVLRKMRQDVGFVEMTVEDIVRSGFVKEYIIQLYNKG